MSDDPDAHIARTRRVIRLYCVGIAGILGVCGIAALTLEERALIYVLIAGSFAASIGQGLAQWMTRLPEGRR